MYSYSANIPISDTNPKRFLPSLTPTVRDVKIFTQFRFAARLKAGGSEF